MVMVANMKSGTTDDSSTVKTASTTASTATEVPPPKRSTSWFGRSSSTGSEGGLDEATIAQQAEALVAALSDTEREHAARCSFVYLWKAVVETSATPEDQKQAAIQMARRYYISKKGRYEVALQKMKSTIAFRQEWDLDGLRLCFSAPDHLPHLDAATAQRYAEYRTKLADRMTTGRVYVSGTDTAGRAIYTIFAAKTKDFEREWFLKESLYNLERAIAITERASKGKEDAITVIGNYQGFTSAHSAPMSLSHEFMDILRQNYPGRVRRVYLLQTPTSFTLFWAVLKPFIAAETRKKIQFLKSDQQRRETFGDLVSLDQATPWMLEDGRNGKEFESQHYLYKLAFDQPFQ